MLSLLRALFFFVSLFNTLRLLAGMVMVVMLFVVLCHVAAVQAVAVNFAIARSIVNIPAHLNRCADRVKKSKHFVYTLPPV